jgi:hypothetical protein
MYNYLANQELPEDEAMARKIVIQSSQYGLKENVLVRFFIPRGQQSTRTTIEQMVVPRIWRQQILRAYHECNSHGGYSRCYLSIRQKYTWINIHQDVSDYVRSCPSCQRSKFSTHPIKQPLKHLPVHPTLHSWSWDTVKMPKTSDNYQYILVMVESLSRFCELWPLQSQSSDAVAKVFYEQIICRYGCPVRLLNDNAKSFTSKIIQSLAKNFNIQLAVTASYRACSNPTERMNGSVIQALRTLCLDNKKEWTENLAHVAFALRSTYSQSLNFSPFHILFGKSMRLGFDIAIPEDVDHSQSMDEFVNTLAKRLAWIQEEVMQSTRNSQQTNEKYANRKVNPATYNIGEEVLVRNYFITDPRSKKLQPLYSGPWVITHKIGQDSFRIQNPLTKKVLPSFLSSERFRKFVHRSDVFPTNIEPASDDFDVRMSEESIRIPNALSNMADASTRGSHEYSHIDSSLTNQNASFGHVIDPHPMEIVAQDPDSVAAEFVDQETDRDNRTDRLRDAQMNVPKGTNLDASIVHTQTKTLPEVSPPDTSQGNLSSVLRVSASEFVPNDKCVSFSNVDPKANALTFHPTGVGTQILTRDSQTSLRPRRNLKRPAKFQDMILYPERIKSSKF